MTIALPPPVAALIEAHNRHDPAAFVACIADDATFRDQGRVHHGRPAIRAWFEAICRDRPPGVDVTGVNDIDGEVVLAIMSCDRGGEARAARWVVATEDGKVVALRVIPPLMDLKERQLSGSANALAS